MMSAPSQAQQPLRLLCFDGGGVRGLSSLYIIQQLMEAIDRDAPPKPCQFFDMIGGTSTGGLIAIMLGRLEMSVADCITAYSSMMNGIFKKKQHRVRIDGKLQARFDTGELERCIKSVVREYGLGANENLLMRDRHLTCKVFACATPMSIATDVIRFSSYRRALESASNLYEEVTVWEVCRATAAASTFFDPIKIGPHRQEFVDGATRANNPINELWREAADAFGPGFAQRVQCLVSIGTGESGVKPFGKSVAGLVDTLKHLATETQTVFDDFKYNHPDLYRSGLLLRLNVVRGLENVALENAAAQGVIAQMTMAYMSTQDMRETLTKFRGLTMAQNGVLSPTATPANAFRPAVQPRAISQQFLTLGRENRHVNPNPRDKSYWARLTLDALLVYEKVYKSMQGSDGQVTRDRFIRYFRNLSPLPASLRGNLAAQVWARLPLQNPHDGGAAPKDLVLAAVYMMHMEGRVEPAFRPNFVNLAENSNNANTFSYHRAKFLWRYGNWVRCACGCGRRWSFANGVEGLRFDRWKRADRVCEGDVEAVGNGGGKGTGKAKGAADGFVKRLFKGGEEKRRAKALGFFEKNRVAWNQLQKEEERIPIGSTL